MAKRFVCGGLFGAALVAVAWWIASRTPATPTPNAAQPKLPIDWSLTKEFPTIPDPDGGPETPAERLTLQVEEGWLVVRLEAADGRLQWHIVLARATEPAPPAVEVDSKFRSVDVRYGPYFVRENAGRLRVYREKKTSAAPAWPLPKADPEEKPFGFANNLRMGQAGDWFWLTAGAVPDRPDVRIRFQHVSLRDKGHGYQGFLGGLAYAFCGSEGKCFDEGDLLTARRVPPYEAEATLRYRKVRAEFGTKPPPALDGATWFNTSAPLTLDRLRGKVVLLDFWGKWCGPCVAKLPAVQALHDKFKDRGLVVIGVHSADQHDGLAAFLTERKVTVPVLIDSGKTASRYLIEAWPAYFLIDKSGKVVSGFTSQPPTAERIEALLSDGS
jgi:thiol-disulfide isomerase/thioredoxin